MTREHTIKKNLQYLRQRRISLISRFFWLIETFAANANRKKLLCSQAYYLAEGLLKAHAPISSSYTRGGAG